MEVKKIFSIFVILFFAAGIIPVVKATIITGTDSIQYDCNACGQMQTKADTTCIIQCMISNDPNFKDEGIAYLNTLPEDNATKILERTASSGSSCCNGCNPSGDLACQSCIAFNGCGGGIDTNTAKCAACKLVHVEADECGPSEYNCQSYGSCCPSLGTCAYDSACSAGERCETPKEGSSPICVKGTRTCSSNADCTVRQSETGEYKCQSGQCVTATGSTTTPNSTPEFTAIGAGIAGLAGIGFLAFRRRKH